MSTYLIKEGNHYASGLHLGVHFGITEQKYRVKFSKECLYTPDWENDWNKLCGWSYGIHHTNSIRIAWRPYVDTTDFFKSINIEQIELCIYVYENGIRSTSRTTATINPEKLYNFRLKYDIEVGMVSIFGLNITGLCCIRYHTKPSIGYRLFPYIGGNNVATRDTKIELQRL